MEGGREGERKREKEESQREGENERECARESLATGTDSTSAARRLRGGVCDGLAVGGGVWLQAAGDTLRRGRHRIGGPSSTQHLGVGLVRCLQVQACASEFRAFVISHTIFLTPGKQNTVQTRTGGPIPRWVGFRKSGQETGTRAGRVGAEWGGRGEREPNGRAHPARTAR